MSEILHILQHALGVDQYGRGQQYRRHFVTGEGSLDHPSCMSAVDQGLMTRHAGNAATGDMDLFLVTDAGRAFVRDHSPAAPKLSRSKRRYMRWLEISDVCPDLTFGDFMRREKEFAR